MVNLHTIQAHNAALTSSLASGLVAVFGKFNVLQHYSFYMNNRRKISSPGSLLTH